jgi:hypothetical protein
VQYQKQQFREGQKQPSQQCKRKKEAARHNSERISVVQVAQARNRQSMLEQTLCDTVVSENMTQN